MTDFPLFEMDETTEKLITCHHPFTAPKSDHIQKLYENPLEVIDFILLIFLSILFLGFQYFIGKNRILNNIVNMQLKSFSSFGRKYAILLLLVLFIYKRSLSSHMEEQYGIIAHV